MAEKISLLKGIVTNRLSEKELREFNLNDVDFSQAIDLYDSETGVSRIVLMTPDGNVKPTEREIVRVMKERYIIETLEYVHENEQTFNIYLEEYVEGRTFNIIIEVIW